MANVALAAGAAAAAAGAAYLNARFSLQHDLLFFGIFGANALLLSRAERSGRLNFFYVLEEFAKNKTAAGRPCLMFEDRSYTFAETYQMVLRWGTWLKEQHGVAKDDIVALDIQNSDTFFFAWFGLWSIGATPAFVNYNLAGPALAHSIRTSTARLVLVDPRVAENVTEQIQHEFPGARFVVLTPDQQAEAAATPPVRSPDADRRQADRAGIAILIYTSGTTGLPKAANVSWGKVWAGATIGRAGTGVRPTDVMYTCMPLYHSSAALLGCLGTLRSGGATALGRKFSTKTFWPDVRRFDATIIQYVGETCRYLLVAPPELDPATGDDLDRAHRVRAAFGNGLRGDVWGRFKERFGIATVWEVYAATEGAGALWNLSGNGFAQGAIGRYGAVSNALLRRKSAVVRIDLDTEQALRDPATGLCARAPDGEPGELLFLLPEDIRQTFQGYFGNQSATEAKVLRDVLCRGDAYFRTGDLVRWEADGRVFFVDRIGDTFRWKSENVSTAEVAEAMGDHPAVLEANVYGVEIPHHDGRAGCAAVALSPADPTPAVLRSLADHIAATLPRYAAPLFLRVSKEVGLQLTGTNKQQKSGLRQQGVAPERVGDDQLFWLRDGTYVPFRDAEWTALESNQVKL